MSRAVALCRHGHWVLSITTVANRSVLKPTLQTACICCDRLSTASCDNCDRPICRVHERRHEVTGAGLCRFCNHWAELPIAELLETGELHPTEPVGTWDRSLICPDCDISMVRGPIGKLMVDCCSRCGGFWFDRTDLALFTAQFDHYPSWRTLPVRLFSNGELNQESICPRCGTDSLIVGRWNDRAINQCQRCIGLWLTPAELNPIVRLMEIDRRRKARTMPRSQEREALVLGVARAAVNHASRWYRH